MSSNLIRVVKKNNFMEMEHPKRWFCALSVLSVILLFMAMVIMFIVVVILLKVSPNSLFSTSNSSVSSTSTQTPIIVSDDEKSWEHRVEWQECGGKCELDGYETPPLIIMSFDGFARFYLDRKEMKTLNSIAKCGAKTNRVMPSFPTKTFPNHYSIVTGLFPESHGITDNNVFDANISMSLESMKSTKYSAFFVGEPIWSVYKRKSGKPANCLFWVGCAHNQTGYAPDVSPYYNQDLPFRNRIEQILEWLKEPVKTRPGLITAYLHEPDNAGHYQFLSEDVDRMLDEIDDGIDYFMSQLKISGLLDCVNIAIVADHGMELINKTYYFDDYLKTSYPSGIVSAKGVVSRLYINDSTVKLEELRDVFRCKVEDFKVNTRDDLPTRKHYSRSSKVGDIILEGPPGTCFYKSESDDSFYSGDHGYDFFNPNMHTIFFARGPGIKENSTIQNFQNVQYMNLWMDLLNISGAVETNGSVGFFDGILRSPPTRQVVLGEKIKECSFSGSDNFTSCSTGAILDFQNCSKISEIPIYIFSSSSPSNSSLCYQKFCENQAIFSSPTSSSNYADKRKGIVEMLSSSDNLKNVSGVFVNSKYNMSNASCSSFSRNYSISVRDSGISSAYFEENLPSYFVEQVYTPFHNLMLEYISKFSKIFVISGVASDLDHDGIHDQTSTNFTHFYRILLRCSENSTDLENCKNLKSLAFIFPIISKNNTWDCMSSTEILLDYTATIFDVEQISGLRFEFEFGNLTTNQMILLRRNITTQLW